tara:strand:- start:272 stop:1018 length:747 start_codon:yes stop_codon:yes gene_type:complete
MPNHCYNHLEVTGDEKQLREFVEKSLVPQEESKVPDEIQFTFNGTHPMPEELNITKGTQTQDEKEQAILNLANHGYTDWYEWHIGEWGTKWDAYDACIQHDDADFFSVSFDTAWSPPLQWIDNIMIDFPDLEFVLEYSEEGMGFGGRLTAQHGVIWDNLDWDIDNASECCEGKVYYTDDEEFTLPQISDETLSTWVGKDKMWKTIKDIPAYHIFPDYQCGVCGEECETISMNAAEIKTNIKEIKNNEN